MNLKNEKLGLQKIYIIWEKKNFFLIFIFWLPSSVWISQARNKIRAAVAIYTAVAKNPESSLTPCAGLGIEPASQHFGDTVDPAAPQQELPKKLNF